MKEETMLSLKWHSFPSHLAVSLDTCYEKQQFVDLSLVCKDGTILKCHKMVLANASPFFRRLLVANEHPHPMIILHDVEADELKTIVNFMYCGEIQVVQSEVRSLLKLAEMLEVTGLRHIQTSILAGEVNNSSYEVPKKTTTVAPLKIDDNKNSSTTKNTAEYDFKPRTHNKATRSQTQRLQQLKNAQEALKRNEENSINALSHRLETGRSGISIVDINDQPSTSRGLSTSLPIKRKEPESESSINWQTILSSLSMDKKLPLKKMCLLEEVEITPSKPGTSTSDTMHIVNTKPLDRRKEVNDMNEDPPMKCAVFIKDEIDIAAEMEEDVNMDPLKVDEVENENETSENMTTRHVFWSMDRTSVKNNNILEFQRKKKF